MQRVGDAERAHRIVRRSSLRGRAQRLLRSKELGLVVALIAAALVLTM